MVEHDVLALEAKRLKGGLLTAGQELAGLENRKAQLRFSMEERKQEIQVGWMTNSCMQGTQVGWMTNSCTQGTQVG